MKKEKKYSAENKRNNKNNVKTKSESSTKDTYKEDKRIKNIYHRYRKKDYSRILFISVIAATTIICLADFVVVIVLICMNDKLSFQEISIDTLLSTGLSIIGIAISVWAGLNIIQILGRNRLNEIVDQYSRLEDERRELYRNQFINELKKQDRASSKYFSARFFDATKDRDDIPASVYHKLFILENNYESVYLKGSGKINEVDVFVTATLSEEVAAILAEISASEVCETNYDAVLEYLRSRTAELNYNFSYGKSDQPDVRKIDHCKKTILEYSDMYHLDIFADETRKKILENCNIVQCILAKINPSVNDMLRYRYVIHVVNLLADSFSYISYIYLESKSRDELEGLGIIKEVARGYASIGEHIYENLLKWVNEKNLFLNEFIYRNYAAVMERGKRIAGFEFNYVDENDKKSIKKIRDNYKKAFELERETNGLRSTKDSVFKTNGSLYVKVVGKMDVFSLAGGIDKQEIEQWTDEIIEYMKLAIMMFSQKLEHYKVLGIALTYKLGFIINRHDFGSVEKYKNQIVDIMKKLEMEVVKEKNREKDDYTKLLEANFEKIKNRL